MIGLRLLEIVKDLSFQAVLALFLALNFTNAGEVSFSSLFSEHLAHLAKYMVIEGS